MFRRSDYHYELPAELIAQHPAERRDGARLLVVRESSVEDRRFVELPALLPEGAVVVVNDTRVLPARVRTRKAATGGAVELFFVEPAAGVEGGWTCLARPLKGLRDGMELVTERGGERVVVVRPSTRRDSDNVTVRVDGDVNAFLERVGELPLPHYIERGGGPGVEDGERYQTLFARDPGAVAAPTAGLHFTPAVLDAIAARGATLATVTLHVGLGTFSPVRDDDLAAHVMHHERYDVPEATAALVASGRPVVAVGTTVVRTLESAAVAPRRVAVGPGTTELFIRPGVGFEFRVVDHLVTNFHLPESTLLMLVSAFAGIDRVRDAYAHAVAGAYRFFSYGDAMLLTGSRR